MPRTVSATRRALRGARRMYLARAITSITVLPTGAPLGFTARVAAEVAGGRELAEPVANHVLADEHRDVLSAVVDRHRVPDHLRIDGRGPGPRADHPLLSCGVQPRDLLGQILVDEGALLERTTHDSFSCRLRTTASPHPTKSLISWGPRGAQRGRLNAGFALPLLPPPDDQLVGRLLRLTSAQAQGGLAPRRLRVAARPGLALAAAMWVVGRIHRRTPDSRACAHPARASRLATRLVFVLQVADLAKRGRAPDVNAPQLARRHADNGVVPLFGQELSRRAGRPHELSATPERQLDVVDRRADRDARERQGVANPDRSLGAAHDLITDLEPKRGQDVPLLAVTVVDEGDASGAVGVVLDGCDLPGHPVLVAPEVDLPVSTAPVTTTVAHRDLALVVAAGPVGQLLEQAPLRLGCRDLLEARGRHEAPPRAGRPVLLDRHVSLYPSEQAFQLLARFQGDDRLLPVRGAACHASPAGPPHLAAHPDGVDGDHLDALRLVDVLERTCDLRLGRVPGDPERVSTLLKERVRALAHQRSVNHFRSGSSHEARYSSISPSASFAMTSRSWVNMSYRLRFCARTTLAHGRLLTERATTSLAAGRTSRTVPSTPRSRSTSTMARVLGVTISKPATTVTLPSLAFTLSAERRASRRIFRGIRCA